MSEGPSKEGTSRYRDMMAVVWGCLRRVLTNEKWSRQDANMEDKEWVVQNAEVKMKKEAWVDV